MCEHPVRRDPSHLRQIGNRCGGKTEKNGLRDGATTTCSPCVEAPFPCPYLLMKLLRELKGGSHAELRGLLPLRGGRLSPWARVGGTALGSGSSFLRFFQESRATHVLASVTSSDDTR